MVTCREWAMSGTALRTGRLQLDTEPSVLLWLLVWSRSDVRRWCRLHAGGGAVCGHLRIAAGMYRAGGRRRSRPVRCFRRRRHRRMRVVLSSTAKTASRVADDGVQSDRRRQPGHGAANHRDAVHVGKFSETGEGCYKYKYLLTFLRPKGQTTW